MALYNEGVFEQEMMTDISLDVIGFCTQSTAILCEFRAFWVGNKPHIIDIDQSISFQTVLNINYTGGIL